MIAPSAIVLIPVESESATPDGAAPLYVVYTLDRDDYLGAVGVHPDTGYWKYQRVNEDHASIVGFTNPGDAATAMLSEETL